MAKTFRCVFRFTVYVYVHETRSSYRRLRRWRTYTASGLDSKNKLSQVVEVEPLPGSEEIRRKTDDS